MERALPEQVGIKALSRAQVAAYVTEELKQPAYRAKQLIDWLYCKGAQDYDEMTNLPKAMRETLTEKLPITAPEVVKRQVSSDGTRKYLIRLAGGSMVEAVGMPSKDRLAVCVSTQAGCPMRCAFCATGRNGYDRNLGPAEIVDQVRIVGDDFATRVTSVVLMGQGEPFKNYDASIEALRIMNLEGGLNIGARHLTLSTCGILPQIRRFAAEPEQFTLAISLHSAVQETRDELMPGVKQYTLERLKESLASYVEATGRRPTYEYAMIKGVNDSNEHLKALQAFCRNTLCHVNLIRLNKVTGSKYQPSEDETVQNFLNGLTKAHIQATIRESRGTDIDAACGQLKQRL